MCLDLTGYVLMTSEIQSSPTKICPTCGTRIAEDATRCLVCGAELASGKKTTRPEKAVEGSRLPRITLGLPALLGFIAILIIAGAMIFYFAFRPNSSEGIENTVTPTLTSTATVTVTSTPSTPTPTFTPAPSPTPLVYTVKLGDSCGGIAFSFGVSIQSIVLLNNLPADCSTLYEGQRLLIPQPTPTVTSLPTSTFSPAEATEAALRARGESFSILHLAAHGVLNTISPLFSHIVLAPDAEHDGKLNVHEVYDLNLQYTELVVLTPIRLSAKLLSLRENVSPRPPK